MTGTPDIRNSVTSGSSVWAMDQTTDFSFESQWWQRLLSLALHPDRLWGQTQPPTKHRTGIPFLGVKWPANEADDRGGPPVQITGTRRSGRGTHGPTVLRMLLPFSAVDVITCRLYKLIFHPQAQVTLQLKSQSYVANLATLEGGSYTKKYDQVGHVGGR